MAYTVKFQVPDSVGESIKGAAKKKYLPTITYLRQLITLLHTGKLTVVQPKTLKMLRENQGVRPRPVGRPVSTTKQKSSKPKYPRRPINPLYTYMPLNQIVKFGKDGMVSGTVDGPTWDEIDEMFQRGELSSNMDVRDKFGHNKDWFDAVMQAWVDYFDWLDDCKEWDEQYAAVSNPDGTEKDVSEEDDPESGQPNDHNHSIDDTEEEEWE